jgi:ABC-type multidrug transport system fused ATPase/permease subunit
MFGFAFLQFIIFLFYLTIIAVVFFLIYTWVNKFISLKQEQNDLLKEIIKKLDNKSTKLTEE